MNLAQEFEINIRITQTTQLQINVYIDLPNGKSIRVNEMGWLGPSQPTRFLFKKQNESALKYT